MTKAGSGQATPSEPVAGVNRRCPLFPPLFERPVKAGVWQSLPCRQVVGLSGRQFGWQRGALSSQNGAEGFLFFEMKENFPMLDIKFVCNNPDVVKQNIKNKFQEEKLPQIGRAHV